MSNTTKKWLILAASLVTVGAIMFIAVMTAYHWDFSRLNTEHFKTNTHQTNEEFSNIKINTETADISFATSSDNTCKVVCYEEEKTKHSVSVKDGTLTITAMDNREWHEHIGFSFHSPKITVYLPKTEYASLVIKESTRDIEIPNEIKVDSADISLSTGDIRVKNISAGKIRLSSSTGNIIVSDVTCTGDMKASVTTGDVKITDVTCQNLISTGSTGDISLKSVIASGKFTVKRSTGNVRIKESDAENLEINTDTGNITGSLISSKVFIAHSDTGDTYTPETTSGGKCKITTDTGNIKITVND